MPAIGAAGEQQARRVDARHDVIQRDALLQRREHRAPVVAQQKKCRVSAEIASPSTLFHGSHERIVVHCFRRTNARDHRIRERMRATNDQMSAGAPE
ncbi:MAG: hypothetical protein QM756_34620 [Polyangiaceae bacterium]